MNSPVHRRTQKITGILQKQIERKLKCKYAFEKIPYPAHISLAYLHINESEFSKVERVLQNAAQSIRLRLSDDMLQPKLMPDIDFIKKSDVPQKQLYRKISLLLRDDNQIAWLAGAIQEMLDQENISYKHYDDFIAHITLGKIATSVIRGHKKKEKQPSCDVMHNQYIVDRVDKALACTTSCCRKLLSTHWQIPIASFVLYETTFRSNKKHTMRVVGRYRVAQHPEK
jgi:hypothetical protein